MSTDQNKIHLNVEYSHQWIDHPLDLVVKVDERTIHMDLSGQREVSIDKIISLQPGTHCLTMRISNKNAQSTHCDTNGIVLDDSYIKITKFVIDDIDLTKLFLLDCKFLDINGEITDKPGGLYCNGHLQYNFESPIYTWVLRKLFDK